MNDVVIVALISLAGSALGAFGGIVASSRLTSYRIEQLEKEACGRVCPKDTQQFTIVNECERSSYSNSRKHNNFDARLIAVEEALKHTGGERK